MVMTYTSNVQGGAHLWSTHLRLKFKILFDEGTVVKLKYLACDVDVLETHTFIKLSKCDLSVRVCNFL